MNPSVSLEFEEMIQFFDHSDLVEQEQDSINRILNDEKAPSVEFPYSEVVRPSATQDAACSPTGLPEHSPVPKPNNYKPRPQSKSQQWHRPKRNSPPNHFNHNNSNHFINQQPANHIAQPQIPAHFRFQIPPTSQQFYTVPPPPLSGVMPFHPAAFFQPGMPSPNFRALPPGFFLQQGFIPQPNYIPMPSPHFQPQPGAPFIRPTAFQNQMDLGAQPPPPLFQLPSNLYNHASPPPQPELPEPPQPLIPPSRPSPSPLLAHHIPPPNHQMLSSQSPSPQHQSPLTPQQPSPQQPSPPSEHQLSPPSEQLQSSQQSPKVETPPPSPPATDQIPSPPASLTFGSAGLPHFTDAQYQAAISFLDDEAEDDPPVPHSSPSPLTNDLTSPLCDESSPGDASGEDPEIIVNSPTDLSVPSPEPSPPSSVHAPPAPQEPPKPAAPKTWASLLKSPNYNPIIVKADDMNRSADAKSDTPTSSDFTSSAEFPSIAAAGVDPLAESLARTLSSLQLEHGSGGPEVRGLANRGNWCYVNAVLQALLACPPFYHLCRRLGILLGHPRPKPSTTPTLDGLAALLREMTSAPATGKAARRPLEPVGIQELVTRLCPSDPSFKHGRQEDAQEFLLALLNAAHDELLALSPSQPQPVEALSPPNTSPDRDSISGSTTEGGAEADDEEEDEDEWHQVGPGRRIAVTREANFTHSLLSSIFVGQLRYQISEAGTKDAVNLQPFFTLPLDIDGEGTTSVETALGASLSKESIKRTASGSKTEVDAKKAAYLSSLPPVLILHLKYFAYTGDGMAKLLKPIHFDTELTIGPKMLTPKAYFPNRQYKLFAVVFHHGEAAQGGHYTADVFTGGRWVELDDGDVRNVSATHLQPSSDLPRRVPYLLFYRRADLIPPPPPPSKGSSGSGKKAVYRAQ